MKKKKGKQGSGEKLLRYGVRLFLRNKDIDTMTVANKVGSISLTRKQGQESGRSFAIGFGSDITEESED